jgi:glycolate oxidase
MLPNGASSREMALDEKVKQELVRVVGEKNVSDALMDLVSYSYDFSGYRFRPQIAVWPTSTEQVSQVMRIAGRARIPLVPRGAGTGGQQAWLSRTGGALSWICSG